MQINKRGNKTNIIYPDEPSSSQFGGMGMRPIEQRSPIRMAKDTGESGYGEMLYLDPNDVNFRRNPAMSPITEGRQTLMESKSPSNRFGTSVLSAVRHEFNDRRPLPSINVTLENKKRERLGRSPKTINVGETEQDIEYNIRTLGVRRSPKNNNTTIGNMYQYASNTNEQGNIFLEQPMSSGSFLQPESSPQIPYPSGSPMNILQAKGSNDYLSGNSREIQYSMNPRDLREPMPNMLNKMSPQKNVDGDDSTSDNKGNDTVAQLKDLKTQMNRNTSTVVNEGDGMVEQPPRQIRNDMEKIEDYVSRNKEIRDTLGEGEIKKLVRQMTKGYDPKKGTEGRLISTSQTTIPGVSEEIFNDRYKVLQKMNKLSTILLARRGSTNYQTQTLNRSIDDQKKTFDRNTLNSTIAGKNRRQTLNRSPQNKFLYLSLAMISSKGPNCEDRIILRKMRFDKGGVVDLAQEDQRKKKKFQVKKVQRRAMGTRGSVMNYNPKYREKAAKVVQGWWRDLKERYKRILDKIILIQSAWRGRWLRKYIYDIIYLSFLHQRFCDIVEKVMVSHVRPIVWDELFARQKWAKELMGRLLTSKDRRFTNLRIKPYFDKFKEVTDFLGKRNLKSKHLVNKKEIDEKNKILMSKYLNSWLTKANLLKYISKTKDGERQKQKFYAALDLVSGTNKLAKRAGLESAKSGLEEYLAQKMRDRAIKNLILHTPKYENLVKRKYFNKWLKQVARYQLKDFKNGLFEKMLGRLDTRMDRTKLKRYFSQWRSKLPKDKFLNYTKGTEFLERFAFRTAHKEPLKALAEKADVENEKDGILRMLGVKSRYIRLHWRDYLYKWRSQTQKSKDREIQNKMYKKLLTTMLEKRRYRIMSNRFSQWKKQPKLDLDALFDRYKGINDLIRRTWNNTLHPVKEDFFNKLKKKVHPNTYKKYCKRILDQYLNKDNTFLRYIFYRWKDQCKKMDIYDLKVQLLKYLGGSNDSKNRKIEIAKAMKQWKLSVQAEKAQEREWRLKEILKGLDKLHKIYLNREIEIMIRLFRLMNKDYRPKLIEAIGRRLLKPRGSVLECFNRWRRVKDTQKNEEHVQELKSKVLRTNAKRLNERINRDALLKAFFQWKAMCRNPEDYYPKIVKGLETLSHMLKNNQCKEPFEKCKISKNYARRIIPLLKSNKHLKERLDKEALKQRFDQWKNSVLKNNITDLKSNIIFRTKANVMSKDRSNILTKYFTKWKTYRPKTMDSDFYKAIMLVQNFCEKPFKKDVVNAFKNQLADKQKKEGIEALVGSTKTYNKRILRNGLKKWWKRSVLIDPKKFDKIRTKLRIMVRNSTNTPLEYYFRRWIRALVKNPDFNNILAGTDIIKSLFVKHHGGDALDKMKGTIAPTFMKKTIIKNFLPKTKLSEERCLKNYFNRWKDQRSKMELKDLKTNLISKVYTNGKGVVRERFLRKYFNKWTERRPIDLLKALQAWDKINRLFANKYMNDFFGDMDTYGRKKFLYNVVFNANKYYPRRMKPYFDRWRSATNKLTAKLIAQDASSRFMQRTKQYRTNYKIQSLMRTKWNQWKRAVKMINDYMAKTIPQGIDKLTHDTQVKQAPEFLQKLGALALHNKKNQALRGLPKKRDKCEKYLTNRYANKWRNQVTKMIMHEMANRLKYNQLRHLVKSLDDGVLKHFLLWKFKAGITRTASPYEQAIDKIRKTYIRDQFKKFVHRADMMNLKIPRGISTQSALIKGRRNIAKSIGLRNVSMRPFWNKWKSQNKALRAKANRHNLFIKTMGPAIKNIDRIQLRKGFNTWKNQKNQMDEKDNLKQIRSKLMYMVYGKKQNLTLKHYFINWLKSTDTYKKKLAAIEKGCGQLRQNAGKKVTEQLRKLLLKQNKFQRVKVILKSHLKANDRVNIASAFTKWRVLSNRERLLQLKAVLVKSLGNKQDYKNEEGKRSRLHEVLLHWRILCTPQDYLDRLKKIREGSKYYRKGVRKPHLREIFDGIQQRANDRYRRKLVKKFVEAIAPKSDELNKWRAMDIWKEKVGDTDRMKEKLNDLLKKYLLGEEIHKKLINEPSNELVSSMKAIDELKKNNSRSIADFCRGLLEIRRNFLRLKGTKYLHKQIGYLDSKLHNRARIALSTWLRNAGVMRANANAIIIQRFLKKRLNNPADKRKRIVRGAEFIDQFVKLYILNNINQKARQNFIEKTLLHRVGNQDKLNGKMLKDAFTRWKEIVPQMRKIDAATMIQNNYRNLRSRRKMNDLYRRNELLEKQLARLTLHYTDYRNAIMTKWLSQAKLLKAKQDAEIIQKFIHEKLVEKLRRRANRKMKNMLRMTVIKQISDVMKKSSRIIGDKGEVMFKTIEDIYFRRPYNKLTEGLKWISRIKTIKHVMPKIKEGLRNYWLPFAMQKWKKNTWDDKVNKTIRLQNWIRGRLALIKKKNELRRSALLAKYLQILVQNTELRLRIPFKIWDKITKFDKLNGAASAIQKIWKGGMSRNKANKLVSRIKLGKLFKSAFVRQVIDGIEEANTFAEPLRRALENMDSQAEKRYATNNIIDFSNEALRNLYLHKLTGKKAYTDGLSALRRYFDKWNQYNRYVNESATKIQTAFRSKRGRQKRKDLQTLKEDLHRMVVRYGGDQRSGLQAGFRQWLSTTRFLKCVDNSVTIQRFIRPRLAKLLNDKFKALFKTGARNITHMKLNQVAKLYRLNNSLMNPRYRDFFSSLRNKDKYDRLRLIFAKNFAHLDDQLQSLLKEKYLKEWKNKSDKLNEQRNNAAMTLQNGFRSLIARRKLKDLKQKKSHMLRMMLKLINDRDLQKQVAFNLWRTNAKGVSVNENARIIQRFVRTIQNKILNDRVMQKNNAIRKGFEKLCNNALYTRDPFNRIVSESNRVIFNKFCDLLNRKVTDNKKDGLKAIKEEEKDFLLNRLFKIPGKLEAKILHKAINNWKDKSDKTAKLHAAERIQKNFRLFKEKQNKHRIDELITERLTALTKKNDDLTNYYFNVWKKNVQKNKVLRAGRKINKFLNTKYKNAKAREKWDKLSQLISFHDGNWKAIDMLKKMRRFMAIEKLSKAIGKAITADGFEDLKNLDRQKRIRGFLTLIFQNFYKKNEILGLREALRNWNRKAKNYGDREAALENMLGIIDARLKEINKEGALEFLEKLQTNVQAQQRVEQIKEKLAEGMGELKDKGREKFIKKIYRLYFYKKIDKLYKAIEKHRASAVRQDVGKVLLEKLYNNLQEFSYFNYNGEKSSSFRTPTTKFSFKKKVMNPKNLPLKSDKNTPTRKIMPFFVNYLDKKFRAEKRHAMDMLIYSDRYGRFCTLYKNFSVKTKVPQKIELINELRSRSEYMDTQGGYLINLFKLLRKKWIRHVTESMKEPNKMYKLLYLLRITHMHKKVAKQRFIRELTRKWRFASFVKKMARKKLELMYKSLHTSYLQMANEVFGDEDDMNPSVMKEFERFGNNMGMFSNEEPSMNEELSKKYVKGVQKKYIFKQN